VLLKDAVDEFSKLCAAYRLYREETIVMNVNLLLNKLTVFNMKVIFIDAKA
jgi:hypothetical protein